MENNFAVENKILELIKEQTGFDYSKNPVESVTISCSVDEIPKVTMTYYIPEENYQRATKTIELNNISKKINLRKIYKRVIRNEKNSSRIRRI